MLTDPTAGTDPNGGHLAALQPDPRQPFNPFSLQTQLGQ